MIPPEDFGFVSEAYIEARPPLIVVAASNERPRDDQHGTG